MKKEPAVKRRDELRREYDLSRLKDGLRGKYYHRATAGMNLVLIEPEPTRCQKFPDDALAAGLFPEAAENKSRTDVGGLDDGKLSLRMGRKQKHGVSQPSP